MFLTAWPIHIYGFRNKQKTDQNLSLLGFAKYRVLLIHEFFYKLFILFALAMCCSFRCATCPEEYLECQLRSDSGDPSYFLNCQRRKNTPCLKEHMLTTPTRMEVKVIDWVLNAHAKNLFLGPCSRWSFKWNHLNVQIMHNKKYLWTKIERMIAVVDFNYG